MRNAKIISYKVKGSFQHNCSVFARRQDFILTGPHGGAMILRVAEAKTKPIFHFLAIILFALCEPRVRREYLKNDEKLFLPSSLLQFFFLFICERLFCFLGSFLGWLVIIEQAHTKKRSKRLNSDFESSGESSGCFLRSRGASSVCFFLQLSDA